jgi:hypothetical protein
MATNLSIVEEDDVVEAVEASHFSETPKRFGSRPRAVVAQEGAVSSVFQIEGQSTIPSDDLSHKVSIVVCAWPSCLTCCTDRVDFGIRYWIWRLNLNGSLFPEK